VRALDYFLDIIFPPRQPLQHIGQEHLERHLFQKKTPRSTPASWILSSFEYQDPDIKKLVLHLKRFKDRRVADALVAKIHHHMGEIEANHPSKETVLIPIPLHKTALHKRGYNQSLLLAQALSQRAAHRKVYHSLRCTKAHPKQALLPKTQRIHNVIDTFRVTKKIPAREHLVFLIDDVTTTGATLNEARLQLIEHVPLHNLKAITIAH